VLHIPHYVHKSRRKLRTFEESTHFPRYIKETEFRMGIHNPLPSSMACKYTFSSSSHLSGQLTDFPHHSGVQEVRQDSSILRRPSTSIRTRQDHSSSDPRERKGIYTCAKEPLYTHPLRGDTGQLTGRTGTRNPHGDQSRLPRFSTIR
jgi:hypothetical protein